MSYKFFELSKEDTVGIISLNNPPVNAFTLDMAKEFEKIIKHITEMDSIKSLLITGKEKIFSAGADISLMRCGDWTYLEALIDVGQRAFKRLESSEKIVIAVINGHCMGGALELALACDRRFMATGRAKIGLPELKIGLIPSWGAAYRLPKLIGKSEALDLIIRGKLLSAEEAKEMGIVDEIYSDDELLKKALEYAKEISSGATFAIGMIKRCINESVGLSLEESMRLECDVQREVFKSQDCKEGMNAFLEKRNPNFVGK